MKKILFVIMLMPVVVFGVTCEMINDNNTNSKRTLTCDAEKSTTTSYKTKEEYEVLKNSVCTIKCTEEILFSIDPIQKVLAGTSFNYPLYASGIRKCKATYNYEQYETKISKLVNEYNSLTGSAKTTKGNEITNYYSEKKACDNFVVSDNELQNKYSFNGDVSLEIETSTNQVNFSYIFDEVSYDNIVYMDEEEYDACNYSETVKKCLGLNKTVAGWTETSTIFGKYTMDDVILEKYTGQISSTNEGNVCNTGDRYFVSLYELTRPTKNDPTDKGYRLTLTASNLSRVIENAKNINDREKQEQQWEINANCWYQVKNMIFPTANDENSSKYGNSAFQYRIIDLENPFPKAENDNNKLPYNWFGKTNIITSTADNITNLKEHVINLDSNFIKNIREYNSNHSYDTFNFDENHVYFP